MTESIYLDNLKMNYFTIQDAQLYCQLSLINPDKITEIYLSNNKLTDISGVSIFKNLERLFLRNNENLTDLIHLKNIKKLELLAIKDLNLKDEIQTVKTLKRLPNLKELWCRNTFKAVKIKKELKTKRIKIYE